MKRTLIGLVLAIGLAGCTNPGTLTKAHVGIVDGDRSIDLTSHKDTKIDKFKRVAPDGSSIELEGYESVANKGALEASTAQAKTVSETLAATMQMFQMLGAMYVQMQTGGLVKPQITQVQPAVTGVVPTPGAPSPAANYPTSAFVITNGVGVVPNIATPAK